MTEVLRLGDLAIESVARLLDTHGLTLCRVTPQNSIPGSYWGEPEAGLIGSHIYARPDTPVHSILHESCHYLCMPAERRDGLHTDAGGEYAEENGVCYLQILLADQLPGVGRARMCRDMNAWGYTFRLGSAERWFYRDAEDARTWLTSRGILDHDGTLKRTRESEPAHA